MAHRHHSIPDREPLAPECQATVATLQRILDGDLSWATLQADGHAAACQACRERLQAARLVVTTLATAPSDRVESPNSRTDRILDAVMADRRARRRRRRATLIGGLTLAAMVLVAIGVLYQGPLVPGNVDVVQQSDPPPVAVPPAAPAPVPPPPAPPAPVRLSEQWAKASENLWTTPQSLSESMAVAPKWLDTLAAPFTKPPALPDPTAQALEPARKTLAEFPTIARMGLEPITGTAEKAFDRLLRDLGRVKPNS
ncbi:MAG: hypothetical protein RMJ56_11460 [Gemmataceae bacterium]|nr:hypothetical protein [Gemmata sp.]MDW8198208.1 hypothetical protein [Gemmataceae bacterium]